MKHLFTLSERLKGRGRGSAISATSATSASAIFCKLVGMVKLFMPFMKATKRQSDTTFFAESLKSLMSIFAESAESAKSAKPIFANRGVKDVRVSLDQSPTNIQRISNLYITPNRYFTRFAAVFALVFVLGVGNVWGADITGTISFGNATGRTNVNSASVTGNDSQSNSWTITTVGTTSFTNNNGQTYSQIGSGNKPATSITFTTTLPSAQTITAFSAKFGGFSGTAGTVTLKVGETTVGTGSLNAANDVTVSATNTTTSGTVLTVTVTGISKGVKAYYISYSYPKPEEKCNVTLNRNGATKTINNVVVGTDIDDIDGTGAQGGCSEWTFVGWSKTQRAAQNNSTAMDLVTTVDGPGPYYAVYSHTESGGGETTVSMNSFSSTSGDVEDDENVSYEAAQGSASTPPAINSNEIRIYQNGGLLTITANNGVKLTTITIGSSMATSVSYSVDEGTASSNQSISANGTYTLEDIEADEVVFTCKGTDKNSRLYLNSLSVTYSGGSTTYYSTTASCCTPLAQVNGSANLSQWNAGVHIY